MITKVKYPRTPHLPWSLGRTSDDKVISTLDAIKAAECLVVTEKMDGENTTIYADGTCHARSLDSPSHESRTYVKQLAAGCKNVIPCSYRLCGENLFAKHSILYQDLEDYFLVFGVFDNESLLSWDEIKSFCDDYGFKHVPEIYVGKSDPFAIEAAFDDYCKSEQREVEGYVIRTSERINMDVFNTHVVKWVRANHVQTTEHWLQNKMIRNHKRQ